MSDVYLNRSVCLCKGFPFGICTLTDRSRSMAGSETTSQTLGYAIWELAKNPNIQSRLREEVMSTPEGPSYDDIQSAVKMPYMVSLAPSVLPY